MVLGTAPTRHNVTKSSKSILDAADRAEPKLRRATQSALEALQESVPNLEGLIAAGKADAVVTALAGLEIDASLFAAISDATATAAIEAMTPEAVRFGIAFNDPNARAIRWAEEHAASLITGNVDTELIRTVVSNATREGVGPRVTARLLEDMVPLTDPHQKAVNRLFWSIIDDGGTEEFARKQAARKAKKLLRYRATAIARTESVTASNMGQQLLWETAVDLDLLPSTAEKVWLATGDDRTCKICAVMDGQTVGLVGWFGVTDQATSFTRQGSEFKVASTKPLKNPRSTKVPPAHGQCRCTIILAPL